MASSRGGGVRIAASAGGFPGSARLTAALRQTASRAASTAASPTASPTASPATPPADSALDVLHRLEHAAVIIAESRDIGLHLAVEDWLLRRPRQASTPAQTLFLWRNDACAVIGRNQNPFRELHLDRLRRDGVPWIRRLSGGGAVYHDLGNTNYTLVAPRADFDRDVAVGLVVRALRHRLDIPAAVTPRHDIAVHGRKISGSAYKLVRDRSYHHGTMLIDTDLDRLTRYLCTAPDARAGWTTKGTPSVPSQVSRLRDHSLTVSHLAYVGAVAAEFCARYRLPPPFPATAGEPPSLEQAAPHVFVLRDTHRAALPAAVHDTMATLASAAWRFGESPELSRLVTLPGALDDPAMAGATVRVTSRRGQFTHVALAEPAHPAGAATAALTARCAAWLAALQTHPPEQVGEVATGDDPALAALCAALDPYRPS